MDSVKITASSAKHPKSNVKYNYGTAGFRTRPHSISVLTHTLLSTPLHFQDNGVKLVDPDGEMLTSSWESYATLLANANSSTDLIHALAQVIAESKIDLKSTATVVYGHDTRPSCPSLVAALEDGLNAIGAKQLPAGLVTTPQLHYLVKCYNTQGTSEAYGEPTEEGYYKKLAAAYTTLSKGHKLLSPLTVDCANGVGAPKLAAFATHLGSLLPLHITSDSISTPGALNKNCGADYVKTQQKAPPGVTLVPGNRYCSYDGDADRIVYYFADEQGTFKLLDGDKIAGLAAGFVMDLVKEAGLKLEVGVVQTAYANGASTDYCLNVLQVPVTCVPTGVKHLHHAAQSYSIGVYFEANGHGTVLFSPSALSTIFSSNTPSSPALLSLQALTQLINQTVGDAISDMLLVETVLLHRQWSSAKWNEAYTDLPNRLVRVFVEDRYLFEVEDAERRLVKPDGLQRKVDNVVRKFEKGRSFVRPSGTEDCVRVYAEAATRELADELAQLVSGIVFDVAGKGEKPAKFT
ncbi:phosphoacetylglucosamine mutase, partial [Phenoliferia sp. Uapishka_3]